MAERITDLASVVLARAERQGWQACAAVAPTLYWDMNASELVEARMFWRQALPHELKAFGLQRSTGRLIAIVTMSSIGGVSGYSAGRMLVRLPFGRAMPTTSGEGAWCAGWLEDFEELTPATIAALRSWSRQGGAA